MVFVFGSNLGGRHGKGAALFAVKNHGAIYGQGVGLQGSSYAIPTKDALLRVLPISEIVLYVWDFLDFATEHPGMTFNVTCVGCGLAGYSYSDIAPMFADHPANVILPPEFKEVLDREI